MKIFRSPEWLLGATAALFIVFGRFLAPHYEQLFAATDPDGNFVPIAKYCLWMAAFLIVLLVIRIGYRLKNR